MTVTVAFVKADTIIAMQRCNIDFPATLAVVVLFGLIQQLSRMTIQPAPLYNTGGRPVGHRQ